MSQLVSDMRRLRSDLGPIKRVVPEGWRQIKRSAGQISILAAKEEIAAILAAFSRLCMAGCSESWMAALHG